MDTITIPLSDIIIGARLREVNADAVKALAASIREVGQLQPIIVTDNTDGTYALVAGAHRMAAMRLMAEEDGTQVEEMLINAVLLMPDSADPLLAEIDENFARVELDPLQRAIFLAERKQVYEALHPETKAGVAGGKARQKSATEIVSFAENAAEKFGVTPRSVRMSVAIAKGLSGATKLRLQQCDKPYTQKDLTALAELDAEQQGAALHARLNGDAHSWKTAVGMATGVLPRDLDHKDRAFLKLVNTYEAVPPVVKKQFHQYLAELGISIEARD